MYGETLFSVWETTLMWFDFNIIKDKEAKKNFFLIKKQQQIMITGKENQQY